MHAIYLFARHVVGSCARDKAIDRPCLFNGHAHRILVVFADIDDGQFPESSEVEGFMESALINSTIPKETGGDSIFAFILGGECNTCCDGQLCRGHTITA